MGIRSASVVVIAVLAVAVLFVTPILAYKTVNADFSEFEALMNFNGKVKASRSYCCESCICALSDPAQCRCLDWFEGNCPSGCEDRCMCTKSQPPKCTCMAIKSECPLHECPTLEMPK